MDNLLQSRFVTGPNDKLAVKDVYEITEGLLPSRASDQGNEELLNLLSSALRVQTSDLQEVQQPATSLLTASMQLLQGRLDDHVSQMPDEVQALLKSSTGGGLQVSPQDMAHKSLGLFWNYVNKDIHVNPRYKGAYDAARSAIENYRNQPNNTCNPTDNAAVNSAVDIWAAIVAWAKALWEMLKAGLNRVIPELLCNLPPTVRQYVSEKILPHAVSLNNTSTNVSATQVVASKPASIPANATHVAQSQTLLYQPKTEIAPQYQTVQSNADRMDGNPWANRKSDNSVTGSEPDWSTPPDTSYQNLFTTHPRGVDASGDIGPTVDYVPGYRDNAPQPKPRNSGNQKGYDINTVRDLLSNTTPERVMAQYPGFINLLLYHYRLPQGDYSLSTEYKKITQLMDKLKPNWHTTERDGQTIGALLDLSQASPDAVFVLTSYSQSDLVAPALIASSYRYNDITALLKAQYPMAAV